MKSIRKTTPLLFPGIFAVASSLLPMAAQENAPDTSTVFELSPFEVESQELEGYIASNAVSATKIDTPIRNLPVNIDVVTRGLIEDYGATSLKDMVELSGNITASEKPNTLNTQFILRGFSTYINMRNGMARIPNVYGSNIQRVEIVRGPTAVLYGLTDPGGAVNVITRQPTPDRYTRLEYVIGQDDYHRANLEWNYAFDDKQRYLSRIDASWLDKGGHRDHMDHRTKFISTANLIVLSPRVSVAIEGEYRDLYDIPASWWPRIQDAATNTFKMADIIPRTFNAEVPGNFRDAESFVGTATLNIKIGENAFYRGSYNFYDRDLQRLNAASTRVTAGRFLSRFMNGTEQAETIHSLYNQLNVDFITPAYDFRMVFGHELKRSDLDRKDARTDASTQPEIWDLTDPDSWDMTVPAYENLLVNESSEVENLESEFYGVGHLTFDEDRYSILGGIRYSDLNTDSRDRIRDSELDVDHGKWSYQIGAIYRPFQSLGLYANYAESFRTITNLLRRNLDRSLTPFDPTEGTGVEVGLKWDLLDEKVSANLAVYEIEQSGVRRVVPVEDEHGSFQVDTQTGKERARGMDLSLNWNISRNWQLIGSIAYVETETISNEQAPEFEGRVLPNTPKWMTHISTRYSFTNETLKGLTVGATWRYVDETLAYNTVDDFFLDEYHIVNAFISYRWNVREDLPVIFRLNVSNVFDEFYFPDTSGPGLPRTARFSTLIRF